MSDSPPAPPLSIVFASATDQGKRRSNNEDTASCEVLEVGAPPRSTLLMVSDGVGGTKAGEVASQMAVDEMRALLTGRLAGENPPPDRRGWIDGAIRETDRRIRLAATEPGRSGMGATLSVLCVAGREAWWGQVGDSRIYRLRGGELQQLSRDQSPVGRMRAAGKLTEEEARAHAYRHVIDGCLGGDGLPVEPETGTIGVEAGDVFLLCSDGLSDGLWDREILDGLLPAAAGAAPDEVARALVARANDASGKDNITVVIARADLTAANCQPRNANEPSHVAPQAE